MPRPDLPLEEAKFIAFDTETTGLYPVLGRLVEIGAVRFHPDGREIARFEQLINPEMPIPPEAQAVNCISDEMVQGEPTVDAVLPRFLDFLGGSDNILIAHNAAFDVEFIGVDLLRLGHVLPGHLVFDTLILAQSVAPGLLSYSLQAISIMMGATWAQTHRALADSRLTKDVFLALLRRDPGIKTVADLARRAPPLAFERARAYGVGPGG